MRVVDVDARTVDPSPVVLNRGEAALDDAWRRDGWIAVRAFSELWGVPLPLEGKSFFVARMGRYAVGADPRSFWFEEDQEWEWPPTSPRRVVRYDGAEKRVLQSLELPLGLELAAVVPQGLVLRDAFEEPQLHLLEWDASDARPLVAASGVRVAHGSTLVLERYAELALFDVVRATDVAIQRPTDGEWYFGGSFSPDGRHFAVAARVDLRAPEPSGGHRYEPRWSRMAIVDTADASVTMADGEFDNFATVPVWSHDSEWMIFATPFKGRRLWACNVTDPRLVELRFRHEPGSPLAILS